MSIAIIIFSVLNSFASDYNEQLLSTPCKQYMDSLPLSRSTSFGEEQIVNGNYQGLGQQYNITGSIKSIIFSARSNPSSSSATSSVKVVIYSANQGLPGLILGTQNIVIDSSSTCTWHELVLTSPLNVNGNIIISLEPLIPSVDNFFVQRNTPPDGQNLNLIKIKQANQWFKNLAAGDPAFDFDLMILPIKEVTLTPNFTFNTNALQVAFTNSSSPNTTNFEWDFGDGTTSTSTSPSHQYLSSGIYQVKLKMISSGLQQCVDSIVKPVTVSAVGIEDVSDLNNLKWKYYSADNNIYFNAAVNLTIIILDATGREMKSIKLNANDETIVDCSSWPNGVYLVTSNQINFIDKFYK
ncbi:MAG: PKD domain-containing protein [Bacteroidota bacterium]